MKKPITYLEIDLGALRSNLKNIQRVLQKGTKILLVVKAQAYGHGMLEVARAVRRVGSVVYLGVSNAQEGLFLRKKGIKTPILLLGSVHPRELRELVRKNITLTVSSLEEGRQISAAARRLRKKARVHVELDTGMGRLGVWYAKALSLLFKVNVLPSLDLEGIYTHFPSADEEESSFSKKQIQVFGIVVDLFRDLYPKQLKFVHMANSAGILRHPGSHFNLVRPGILAYGVNPTKKQVPISVKPVLSFKTHVAFLKEIEPGTSVSYGRTYTASDKTRIATLPVGYSSGYHFRLSNRSMVLIRGRAFPIAGRVTMDHVMVDVGDKIPVKRWDEVTLLGRSGNSAITAEDLADKAQTIPYEILCSLSHHIPRFYKQ